MATNSSSRKNIKGDTPEMLVRKILTEYKKSAAKIQGCGFFFASLGFIAVVLVTNSLKNTLNDTEKVIKLQENGNLILYYDEALTMSAFVSALSGNVSWVERYLEYVDPIDTSISLVEELAPDIAEEFLDKTYLANENLIGFEDQVLIIVESGQNRTIAQAIMESEAYSTNKTRLKEGLDTLTEQISARRSENASTSRKVSFVGTVSLVIITVIFAGLAVYTQKATTSQSKADEQRLMRALVSQFHGKKKENN